MASACAGVCAAALVRAAEGMMRALGGTEILLVLPLMQLPDDPSAQLGLVDPGVEQVALSPVVVRNLPTESNGPRRRMEFLIAGSAVDAELSSRNVASAADFFESALGLSYDNEMLHIEGFTQEDFAGTAYLYRVTAVE